MPLSPVQDAGFVAAVAEQSSPAEASAQYAAQLATKKDNISTGL